MEVHVQELLERIKSEGVEAARAEAERILAAAREEADRTVAAAERAAGELESQAKARIASSEAASRQALVHASRDAILALRTRVQEFMDKAVLDASTKAMGPEYLASLLPGILSGLVRDGSSDLEILLPPDTLAALDKALAAKLSSSLGSGITFVPFQGIDSGFRVAMKGSSAQYDFSAEAVARIIGSRVNARLSECLRDAVAETPRG